MSDIIMRVEGRGYIELQTVTYTLKEEKGTFIMNIRSPHKYSFIFTSYMVIFLLFSVF